MRGKIKTIVIIISIIIVAFGAYRLIDYVGYKKWKVAEDNTTSSTQNIDNNMTNTTNEIENEKKESHEIKRITLSDEEIIDILIGAVPFESGVDLSTDKKLEIVYNALNAGKISEFKDRKGENNKVEYTVEEVNGIVYSLFGVSLKENKSYGDAFVYDGEKYVLQLNNEKDNDLVAKNIEYDVAAGTAYINYDLYQKSNSGEVYKGSYAIGKNKESSFIKSKKEM